MEKTIRTMRDCRGSSWFRIALFVLLWAVAGGSLHAGEAAVDFRVVDEVAPPGGLAVILVELTEPKPISGGRIRFARTDSPLGEVVGVAILDGAGEVEARIITTTDGVVVEFSSPGATLGTDPELPFMVVAIEVLASAIPGESVPLELDLGGSNFLDPQGQPYPEETQSGTFTVGGLSITNLEPLRGTLATGSVLRILGEGFDPDVDVNVAGARYDDVTVKGSREIEVLLTAPFELLPTTRFRLRNPNRDEDFFYPAVLLSPAGALNRNPTAVDDAAVVQEDASVLIDVLANDSDLDGDPVTIAGVQSPLNGSAHVENVHVRYQPDPDFSGEDAFQYSIQDGRGGMATATVAVTVEPINDPPLAGLHEVDIAPDQIVLLAPLESDTDPDGDSLDLVAAGAPEQGRTFRNSEGTITYVPPPGFSGVDLFSYVIQDPFGERSTGGYQIHIEAQPAPPEAVDDVVVTLTGRELEIAPLSNDRSRPDPPGDLQIESRPRSGTAIMTETGTVVYQSEAGFAGVDAFDYSVANGSGLRDHASVTVAVNPEGGPRFLPESIEMVVTAVSRVRLDLGELPPETESISLQSTPPGMLIHPASLPAQSSAGFLIQASRSGTAILTATSPTAQVHLPVLVRPGLVSEIPALAGDLHTGLAITNRGAFPGRVNLRAFGDLNGVLAAGAPEVLLESVLNVDPAAQTARLLEEIDGRLRGFHGWLELSSADSDLVSMFLHVGSPVRGFAGASRSEESRTLLAPAVMRPEDQAVLVLISNHSELNPVEISWQGPGEGESLDIVLAPQEAWSGWPAQLLPEVPVDSGFFRVEAEFPLTGYLQVRSERYLYGQAAIRPQMNDRLVLPQLVSGGGWRGELQLVNRGDAVQDVELIWRGRGGEAEPPRRVVPLGQGQAVRLEVGELFGFSPLEVRSGALEVLAGGQVEGAAVLRRIAEPVVATSVPALKSLACEAILSQVVSGRIQDRSFFTGLALFNPQPAETVVVVDLYSPSAELLGHAAFQLQSGLQLTALVRELFPVDPPVSGGYLRVRSTRPIGVVGMFGDSRLNFLATVDAAPVQSGSLQPEP